MATYDWSIGSSATMRIVDTGTYVEFWLNANNSTGFNHYLPWGYTVNGVTDNSNQYDYNAGSGWERLGRWLVTTDQTVTFRIFDTNTNTFGSGASHSVAINRASVPPAPKIASTQSGETSIFVDVNLTGDGGTAVDAIQVGYGKVSSGPQSYIYANLSDGKIRIENLARGTLYYLWARAHNSKGWSGWSTRVSQTTWREPSAPSAPIASSVTQSSMVVKFTVGSNGGTAILESQLGYGRNPDTPETWVTSTGTTTLSDLVAGGVYYLWARSRNAVGWSPTSPKTTVRLIAGARITIGNRVYNAVPYMKVDGVWRVIVPYVKTKGVWKQSQ